MTVNESMMPQSAVRPGTWRDDAMLGLAGALLAFCLHALAGFPTLAAANGDNDSLLRLVEIRDLIGGQGWVDLPPNPMGPAGGFVLYPAHPLPCTDPPDIPSPTSLSGEL